MKRTCTLAVALVTCLSGFTQNAKSSSSNGSSTVPQARVSTKDTFDFAKVFAMVKQKGLHDTCGSVTLVASPYAEDSSLDALTITQAGYTVDIYRNWMFQPDMPSDGDEVAGSDIKKVSELCKQLQKF